MKIEDLYQQHFQSELRGRYITFQHIKPLLDLSSSRLLVSDLGVSENGIPIKKITLGSGSKKVLAWSQMHGNESTTTKAIFDFLQFIRQKELFQDEIDRFLGSYTLVIIPMLNPDGAKHYTRENFNGIDLNRDAKALSQVESRLLRSEFETFKPNLCLNMHDQRSIYGTQEGKSAAVSFLAPSEDELRTVSETRISAMRDIVRLYRRLNAMIPGQIGRYDDTFNEHCVGDSFTMAGVPTILFEAGHLEDYQREDTRELIFHSLIELFGIEKNDAHEQFDHTDYFEIPQNKVNYKDVILRNVRVKGVEGAVSVGIQYEEVLKNGKIHFEPVVESLEELNAYYAHSENDCGGAKILLNYQQKAGIGEKIVSIIGELPPNTIFYSRK